MRHRWIQAAGLGTAFLAAVILAGSLVPVAMAQTNTDSQPANPRALWNHHWFDEATRKALRDTQQPGSWEILVDLGKDGEWVHQGFLEEVYRLRPEPTIALDEALKSILDSSGTIILIGEVRSSKASRLYVVAAVLDHNSSFQDSEGRALKTFVPLHVTRSYQDALQFAHTYEKFYDGSIGNGEHLDSLHGVPAPPGIFEKALTCEQRCSNQQRSNYRYCDNESASCRSSAANFLFACRVTCLGNPLCEAGCYAIYFTQLAFCSQAYADCIQNSDLVYGLCIVDCDGSGGGGGGCGATVTQTATAALSLDDATAGSGDFTPAPVSFSLARAENRGKERFIPDEWAIVQGGWIRASSNPAFARAVTDQGAVPTPGSFLIIQEPVHAVNSRHVPKPEVRIFSTGLAPSERGNGEVVAARLEFSPARVVDRVEIVYTSEPMDEIGLEQLVSRRIGLVFASEKEHRTAVYVVFRLTDRFELLRTFTALPQCCCGQMFCY